MQDTLHEKHYTVKEVANRLGVSPDTARKLIKAEPGVVRIQLGVKKALTTYTVPESILVRIHNKLTA